MDKFEKYFYIFLLILAIFTFGVQVGIYQGRTLEKADCEQRLKGGGDEPSTGMPFNASNQEEDAVYSYGY